jgi:U3 small nucleolar RNA-associated protein 14
LAAVQDADNNPEKAAREAPKKQPLPKRSGARGYVDVDRAVDLLESTAAAATVAALPTTIEEGTSASDKKIATLTQEELVQRAFATQVEQEIEEEFAKEKALVEQDEDPTRKLKKNTKDPSASQGWGSWAGQGAPAPIPRRLPKKLQPPEAKNKRKREDAKKPNVILSEKRVKKTADKFMLSKIPYPFTSREEYERSMSGGVGREWNVTDSFKDMTRPSVITRPGKMIQPISMKAKQKRAPAKF